MTAPRAAAETRLRLLSPAAGQRIAAIDIGSNSIRQIIADVSSHGAIRIVDEMKAAPRLGRGLAAAGLLGEGPMDEAVAALSRMATLARQHGARRVEAVATSAVRDASNGSAFLQRVRRAADFESTTPVAASRSTQVGKSSPFFTCVLGSCESAESKVARSSSEISPWPNNAFAASSTFLAISAP